MKKRLMSVAVGAVLLSSAQEVRVRVGGMSESPYGVRTAETIVREGLGDYTVLFVGPWTAKKIAEVGAYCREHGLTFTMDEMFSRRNGGFRGTYAPIAHEVLAELKNWEGVLDGSLLLCEFGGLMFNWPESTVTGGRKKPPRAETYAEADANTVTCMRSSIAEAAAAGLPRPYVCIEPTGGAAAFAYRAGIDRIDLEVIYGDDLERRYAGVVGATRAFGKTTYGVDMAMVWYGGNQHDALWGSRWRTSLFHSFLRGANPIYAEHGLMNYQALGKDYDEHHPQVKRFRAAVGEIAAWAKNHPRPEGLPLAAVAAVQGRYDGYVGGWQTHLYGQRLDARWRIGDADFGWELFDSLYRRRTWENREKFGACDYSGNPPLGAAEILPYDAPQKAFNAYKTLFFIGRNSMDDALYEKLVAYVEQGGVLLLSAAHLTAATRPGEAFTPYRGGDWTRLIGLRATGAETRSTYGIKFTAEPPCGWRFPLWSANCDPKFTDGGFRMVGVENVSAKPLAVASDRFVDTAFRPDMLPVLYSRQIGKGTVVFLPSIDPPGAQGVKFLYEFLLKSALEAVADATWPKVECSERVRYAVYPGKMYLLNTEERLAQEVIVETAPAAKPVRISLKPGEMKELSL